MCSCDVHALSKFPNSQYLATALTPCWVSCTDVPHLVAFSGLLLSNVEWKSCFPLQNTSASPQALVILITLIRYNCNKFEFSWLTAESQHQFHTHPTKIHHHQFGHDPNLLKMSILAALLEWELVKMSTKDPNVIAIWSLSLCWKLAKSSLVKVRQFENGCVFEFPSR